LGGDRAATVVIAQPDSRGRELLARVVDAAGQHAVQLDGSEVEVIVDTTVSSSALVLVVDVIATGIDGLADVVATFETRRYPAQVMALVDGPASAAAAASAGAAAALERPFPRQRFVEAMTALLTGEPVQAGPDSGHTIAAEADGSPRIHHDDLVLGTDDLASGTVADEPVDDTPTDDVPADDETAGDAPEDAPEDDDIPTDVGTADDETADDETADDETPTDVETADDQTTGDAPEDDAPEGDDGDDTPGPPVRPTAKPGLGDNFTDILKMGRQL